VSQPDLYTSNISNMANRKNLLAAEQRSNSFEVLASSSSSLPPSPSSVSSQGDTETGGTEVAVLDIYVLKQVTNFYHLLKELWSDARIVSTVQDSNFNLMYHYS
jgi:hypothetical protein